MQKNSILLKSSSALFLIKTNAFARFIYPACFLVTALLSSLWLVHNSTRVFDFFDMSAFLDAGYRLFTGQRLYTDFQFNAGPVHPFLHALSFKLFGFGKFAIQAHLLAGHLLALTCAFQIGKRRLPFFPFLACLLLTALSFYGPISHPWYDQNALLWILVSLVLIETLCSGGSRCAALVSTLVGSFAVLSFFTKANIGAAGGGILFVRLLLEKNRRVTVLGFILGSLTAVSLILYGLNSPSEFVSQTLLAYDGRGRLSDFSKLWLVFKHCSTFAVTLGAAGVLALLAGRGNLTKIYKDLLTLVFLISLSYFSVWTGSMQILANIPLLGFLMLYLWRVVSGLEWGESLLGNRVQRAVQIGTWAITFLWIATAFEKSIDLPTWAWRGSNLNSTYSMATGALKGWKTNEAIGKGVDETVKYVDGNIPKDDSLFVFPDATVLYALTGRESYKGVPFIFHLEKLPFPGKYYDDFRRNFINEPPDWIVLHDQKEVYFFDTQVLLKWLALDRFLAEQYKVKWREGEFLVLRRKG